MRRTVGNLFGFSEEIVRPAIKNHASDYLQGHQFFGNQLGRVQMIERKSVSFLLREKLHREFPLRKISRCDGLEHIAAGNFPRSEEHTSELQSPMYLVCRP